MDSLQGQGPLGEETTPVLIVGGSLVGLSAALFLSWYGIPYLLVERHAGNSPHPRAFNFNMRTMEFFHQIGVEDAIRQAAPPGFQNSGILQAESLAGKEFRWITQDTTSSTISRVSGCIIGQDALEPVLRKHAEEAGGDLRFSTELVSFEQQQEGIKAVICNRRDNTERLVFARYLIAADGNRSTIRQKLGIKTYGPGALSSQLSILFDAEVEGPLRGRKLAVCFVNNPDVRRGTSLVFARNGKGFALFTPYSPQNGEREEDFEGEYGIKLIRGAIGIPDLPVKILNVRPWEVSASAAATFQHGNVFLAGDSAHVNPPSGAFGANTGIADAYNLVWKIAQVLKGVASPALLSTYTEERQPVARYTVEQALALFMHYASGSPSQQSSHPIVPYNSVAFGYCYHSAALSSELAENEWYEDPDHPSGRPGTHAAHVVLERRGEEGKRCSTLDLLGKHLVLLSGEQGGAWCDAAREIKERSGLPLDIYRIGSDVIDVEGRFSTAYGIAADGVVVIRPDGFIGWRSAVSTLYPVRELEQALARLLVVDQPIKVSENLVEQFHPLSAD